jgi:hypothetical protein
MKRLGIVLLGLSAFILAGACSSNSDSAGANCWVSGPSNLSCSCGQERPMNAVSFKGTCNEGGVGARGLCCQGHDYCSCRPVTCGITGDGSCTCGILGVDGLASCTGTASTCCTQNTNYCYCEEGCQSRFANHLVNSCDRTTSTVTCDDDETRVASCE